MRPVSLTILFSASNALFPACINTESSTYRDLDTGVGLPFPEGTCTGCVLAARATEITMSATGIQLSGPSVVPCPVPCSCRCVPSAPIARRMSRVIQAAVIVDLTECRSMSLRKLQ